MYIQLRSFHGISSMQEGGNVRSTKHPLSLLYQERLENDAALNYALPRILKHHLL